MKHVNQLGVLFLAVIFGLVGCSSGRPADPITVENPRPESWSAETVAAFGKIPLLDRGRVKPLSTFSGFRFLTINGKRVYRMPKETGLPTAPEKLGPVEWMLDVAFFPEQAQHYEVFVVNDDAVLREIGMTIEGRKKRDRYSYAQINTVREGLNAAYGNVAAKRRAEQKLNTTESQIAALYSAVSQYDLLQSTFAVLQTTIGQEPSARLLELFPEGADGASIPLDVVIERWPTVQQWIADAGPDETDTIFQEMGALERTITVAHQNRGIMLSLFPPSDTAVEEWRDVGELIDQSMLAGMPLSTLEAESLHALGSLHGAVGSMARVDQAVLVAQAATEKAASARGEFASIGLERTYYAGDYFYRALYCFLLAFVLAAFSWMLPSTKWLNYGVWAFTSVGLVLAVAGVTIRCVLLHRPPVATLYETILFITSVAVLVCLIMEKMTKERIALASAAALGAAGMFLSTKYELIEANAQGDTMGGLVAVLNTNFWLATHVTTVTMGYAAGLLAAALAHVWIVLRIGRAIKDGGAPLRGDAAGWYRRFARMVYGVLCFGLLFSVVGTILGGVWANDSWGRFWGWDPKENGALMIVLFELVILHARMGGYLKDFGVCLMAVLGGGVVAFSWWHVNQLGVGLHSYGFTEGILRNLWRYYGFVAGFAALAGLGWAMFLRPRRPPEVPSGQHDPAHDVSP